MPDINLSQKTNLLEQDPYSYELQDVKKPALFHEMFPYNETPKIAFNYRRVPQNMPDDIFITDTTFRDGQQSRTPYTTEQMIHLYKLLHKLGGDNGMIRQTEFFVYSKKDRDALEKCMELGYRFPVIMLTAKTEDTDKITGLTLGADDYIPKPFNPLELVARVKAQLRRYTKYNDNVKQQENIIDFAGLVMNRDTHECTYNEKKLVLTPIEFDILWLLCSNRGRVISSEQLFEQIWKEKYFKNSNNTVMVHIRHLREKMGDGTRKSDFIKTVWGVGYKIEK